MVAFKSYLMHDPPNSQLFLANLELAPFLDNFDGPVGLHGCVITLSPFMSYERMLKKTLQNISSRAGYRR